MKSTVVGKAEKARELLMEATQLMSEIIEGNSEVKESDEWAKNRLEFWSRILLEGGQISNERAHEIWEKEMKKDARGYGGHFVGKRASLQYSHDGKVMLTMHADEKCIAWIGISLAEYAKKFKKK